MNAENQTDLLFLGQQKRALELIVRGAPLAEVLTALAETVEEESQGASVASILLLDSQGRLCNGAGPSLPEHYRQAIDGVAIDPDLGTCAAAAARRDVVVTVDFATDPGWRTLKHLPLAIGLVAAWSMPILSSDGHVLGTFGTYFREKRGPTRREREIVEVLARTAGLAIEHARLHGSERRARAEAEALAGVNTRLAQLIELPELLSELCRSARQLAGSDGATFVIREGDRVHYQAEDAIGKLWAGQSFPIDACISGWSMLQDRPALIPDIYADSRIPIAAYRPTFVKSLAMVPVRRADRLAELGYADPIAALGLYWAKERQVTEGELRLLTSLADVASISFANALLYERNVKARLDAEAANRAKDEFLGMLGHELRNPLAAVRAAILAARQSPERQARALEIAERQTNQLARLLDDLLDVARITQGRVVLRSELCDMADVVQRAIDATHALFEARRHRLSFARSDDPLPLVGDPARLEQVMVNLLNNAAKYTEAGGHIEVATRRDGEAVSVTVSDDGIGMPADLLPRVFDLFAQSERAIDREQGGLGIGLTVVQRVVALHGGQVRAHSDGEGHGSRFEIRLPLADRNLERLPSAVAVPADDASSNGKSVDVLIVEDNADAADALKMLLEALGHSVHAVTDGPSALSRVRDEPPEVMLVDIGLPGIDGYEVARAVRALPLNGSAPLMIALTGYGADEDRKRALAAGFDAHLVKPVSLDDLSAELARARVHATSLASPVAETASSAR